MNNPIIIIAGPTASGKTAIAAELASKFNGEIVNADSRTIYRGMDVATAKPDFDCHSRDLSVEALAKSESGNLYKSIPHHLFDIVKPDELFTVADYKKLAWGKINEIEARGKLPFIVGGTSLYIDSLVYDFNLTDGKPDLRLRQEFESLTGGELVKRLESLDMVSAKEIDSKNRRRLIRALEVSISTGKPFSEQKGHKQKPENILYLSVDVPRETLYARINARIDGWLDEGLVEETKTLGKKYPKDLPSMSAIGYKEMAEYLAGKITKEDALEKMKQRTRNYAKRQMTWLRKNKDIVWIKDTNEAKKTVEEFLMRG